MSQNYRPVVRLGDSPGKSVNAICHICSRSRCRSSQEDHCSQHTRVQHQSYPEETYCRNQRPMCREAHFGHAFPSEDIPHDSLLSRRQCQAPANLEDVRQSDPILQEIPASKTTSWILTFQRGSQSATSKILSSVIKPPRLENVARNDKRQVHQPFLNLSSATRNYSHWQPNIP